MEPGPAGAGANGSGEPLASMELEHAIGFTGSLKNSLHLLPNGQEVIYVAGGCVVIASLSDPHQQTFLRGHTEPICCLDVSPDGRLAVSGQRGRIADVIVWDLEQRRELYRLQEHDAHLEGGIALVAFADDSRFLLTVGMLPEDNKMMVWDMRTGHIVASYERDTPMTCAAWGGRVKDVKRRPTMHPQLVTAGTDGLKYWDLDPMNGLTWEPVLTSTQKRVYTCVAFSPAEDLMFAGTLTGDFCVLNVPRRLSSGELERVNLRLTVMVCSGGIHSLRTDGRQLLVGGGDGSITAYDCDYDDGFKPQKVTERLEGLVTSISVRSGRAVFGTSQGCIYEQPLQPSGSSHGGPPTPVSRAHCARVVGVAYAPGDSVRFATVADDLTMRIWNASDYSVEVQALTRDAGLPLCIAFSGTAVFVGWEDGKIRAYDADDGAHIWAIDECHRGGVSCLVLSHNQRFMCSGGQRGEVRVWELKTRTLVSHLVQHDEPVRAAAGGSPSAGRARARHLLAVLAPALGIAFIARARPDLGASVAARLTPRCPRALRACAPGRRAGERARALRRRPAALLGESRPLVHLLGPARGEEARDEIAERRRHQRDRAASGAHARGARTAPHVLCAHLLWLPR